MIESYRCLMKNSTMTLNAFPSRLWSRVCSTRGVRGENRASRAGIAYGEAMSHPRPENLLIPRLLLSSTENFIPFGLGLNRYL